MRKYNEKIDNKINGPAWNNIRDKIKHVIQLLLAVDESTVAELTTIYIKFKITDKIIFPVYAVLWLKSSKKILLGLATHDKINNEVIIDPPSDRKYKGLKSYLWLKENEDIPTGLEIWIKEAYQNIKNSKKQN